MGRINAVLDEGVAYGFEGGPEYLTQEQETTNRFSDRDSQWEYARHKYSASFEDIDEDARDQLIAAFHACRGKRHSFKFKDWNDFEATLEPLQVESGTKNLTQLYKSYQPLNWPVWTIRPIQALVDGVAVYDVSDPNNPILVPGTFDLLAGTFIPTSNWGAGLYAWTGEFYVWVRFEDDYNPVTINAWRLHTADVSLIEDPIEIMATNVPLSWEE